MKKFEKMAKVAIVYKYEFCPLSFKTKIKSLGWKLSELLALEENPSHPSHHPQVPVLECSLSRTNNNTKQIFNHNFKLMMDFWDTAGIIIWDPQYFLRLISNWIYHQGSNENNTWVKYPDRLAGLPPSILDTPPKSILWMFQIILSLEKNLFFFVQKILFSKKFKNQKYLLWELERCRRKRYTRSNQAPLQRGHRLSP